MKFQFNKSAFLITILLFIVELFIEKTTGFIRHTFGDFIVVILIFYFIKSFVKTSTHNICLTVMAIAYTTETLQLTPILEWLNIAQYKTAKLVFGTTFSFTDLIAYTLGLITIYFIEHTYEKAHH